MKKLIPIVAAIGILSMMHEARALREKEGQVILDKLEDYRLCQSKDRSGSWCHDALVRWVELHPDDAFKAGKLTRLHMNHSVAVPFFVQGLSAKMGECTDPDVKMATMAALENSDEELATGARKIAFELCFAQLKADLISGVSSGGNSYKKNACPGLLKQKALTGLKQKLCEKAGA